MGPSLLFGLLPIIYTGDQNVCIGSKMSKINLVALHRRLDEIFKSQIQLGASHFFFTDLIQDLVLFATNLGKPGLRLFDTPRKPFSLLVSLTELVLKAGDFTTIGFHLYVQRFVLAITLCDSFTG